MNYYPPDFYKLSASTDQQPLQISLTGCISRKCHNPIPHKTAGVKFPAC